MDMNNFNTFFIGMIYKMKKLLLDYVNSLTKLGRL